MNTESQSVAHVGQAFPTDQTVNTKLPATRTPRPNGTSVSTTAPSEQDTDATSSTDDCHLYWAPPGLACDEWSAELRAHVARLINPLYRELVLNAPNALTQSVGVTIVHLTWLEILDQLEIGQSRPRLDPLRLDLSVQGESRPKLIERHLRLVGAKLKFSQFLQRLEDFKSRQHKNFTRDIASKLKRAWCR